MKILFLAHRIPYPPNKGDKIRSFHQLQYLAKRHEVWCACFVDDPKDMTHVDALRGMCKHTAAIPLSKRRGMIRGLGRLVAGGSVSEGFYSDSRMRRTLRQWCAREEFDAALSQRPEDGTSASVTLGIDIGDVVGRHPDGLLIRLQAQQRHARY